MVKIKCQGKIKGIFRRVLVRQNHGLHLQKLNCSLKSPQIRVSLLLSITISNSINFLLESFYYCSQSLKSNSVKKKCSSVLIRWNKVCLIRSIRSCLIRQNNNLRRKQYILYPYFCSGQLLKKQLLGKSSQLTSIPARPHCMSQWDSDQSIPPFLPAGNRLSATGLSPHADVSLSLLPSEKATAEVSRRHFHLSSVTLLSSHRAQCLGYLCLGDHGTETTRGGRER